MVPEKLKEADSIRAKRATGTKKILATLKREKGGGKRCRKEIRGPPPAPKSHSIAGPAKLETPPSSLEVTLGKRGPKTISHTATESVERERLANLVHCFLGLGEGNEGRGLWGGQADPKPQKETSRRGDEASAGEYTNAQSEGRRFPQKSLLEVLQSEHGPIIRPAVEG